MYLRGVINGERVNHPRDETSAHGNHTLIKRSFGWLTYVAVHVYYGLIIWAIWCLLARMRDVPNHFWAGALSVRIIHHETIVYALPHLPKVHGIDILFPLPRIIWQNGLGSRFLWMILRTFGHNIYLGKIAKVSSMNTCFSTLNIWLKQARVKYWERIWGFCFKYPQLT